MVKRGHMVFPLEFVIYLLMLGVGGLAVFESRFTGRCVLSQSVMAMTGKSQLSMPVDDGNLQPLQHIQAKLPS